MNSHSLLQEIFPTQGSNSGLLHCKQILYHHSFYIYSLEFYCTRLHFIYLFMKLFIYMYMESWIYSLFHELLFITIYFVTKIVSDLATGNPFNVNPVFLIISSSFLGWEDPLEKGKATPSSILA